MSTSFLLVDDIHGSKKKSRILDPVQEAYGIKHEIDKLHLTADSQEVTIVERCEEQSELIDKLWKWINKYGLTSYQQYNKLKQQYQKLQNTKNAAAAAAGSTDASPIASNLVSSSNLSLHNRSQSLHSETNNTNNNNSNNNNNKTINTKNNTNISNNINIINTNDSSSGHTTTGGSSTHMIEEKLESLTSIVNHLSKQVKLSLHQSNIDTNNLNNQLTDIDKKLVGLSQNQNNLLDHSNHLVKNQNNLLRFFFCSFVCFVCTRFFSIYISVFFLVFWIDTCFGLSFASVTRKTKQI